MLFDVLFVNVLLNNCDGTEQFEWRLHVVKVADPCFICVLRTQIKAEDSLNF